VKFSRQVITCNIGLHNAQLVLHNVVVVVMVVVVVWGCIINNKMQFLTIERCIGTPGHYNLPV
jgi:hypothetical protein